jgi:hypothetical protein
MHWPAVRYLARLYQGHYPQLALSSALPLLLVPSAWLVGVAFDQVLPSGNLRWLVGLDPATLMVSHEQALVRRANEVYDLDGGRLVLQPRLNGAAAEQARP